MRRFILVTSWILWSLCTMSWLILAICRKFYEFRPATKSLEYRNGTDGQRAEIASAVVQLSWRGFIIAFLIASGLHLARRYFWWQPRKEPGFGYWFLICALYLALLAVMAFGFTPYFEVNDRSMLQWLSLAISGMLLIHTFPRLPKES